MQITRSSIDTQNGPADSFTGDVYVDVIAAPAASSTFAAALVHFTPSACTAWHTHPHGQTIFVTPVTWGRHVTDEEYGASATSTD
jgi:quercetin dioxygenase-like cupin family protein